MYHRYKRGIIGRMMMINQGESNQELRGQQRSLKKEREQRSERSKRRRKEKPKRVD